MKQATHLAMNGVMHHAMRPVTRRGMTLVELMIGIAIGLFLVAVMGTVYVGSRTTFVAQESGSRLQENGRTVTAKAADPDTLVASAKAYIGALNKLMLARLRGPTPQSVEKIRPT